MTMIAEYENPSFGNTLRPKCTDFRNSGGSAHFSWCELNGRCPSNPPHGNPHYDAGQWGLIHERLLHGLEATRANYARGGITITSGYRCPHGNAGVNGKANSWHTHGRAADMYSANHVWTEQEFEDLRAAARLARGFELNEWGTYRDRHLHAAW